MASCSSRSPGRRGIGKTSLVRHFLAAVRKREEVTILRGRCYPHESVPFKAFDALMDGLRRRLKRMTDAERAAVLPEDLGLLTRLFPVLREVEEFTEEGEPDTLSDLIELRQRSFETNAALIANLARQRPLVTFIDDVHWADADSARLLSTWLRVLARSPALIVLSYQADDASSSEFLGALDADPVISQVDRRKLTLEELSSHKAAVVARGLVSDDHPEPAEAAVWIADQSAGNPHLMAELAAHLRATTAAGAELDLKTATLDDLLRARVDTLDEGARAVLEMVAVAGRPVPLRVVEKAVSGHDALAALAPLRAQSFVRVTQSPFGDLLETYHPRIRTAITDAIEPSARGAKHLRLAQTMEAQGWKDPETLLGHYHQAGLDERAAHLALEAARAAADTLAFEKAARLFRTALELREWEPETAEVVLTQYADALVYAGRGEAAARAYLDAAGSAEPGQALILRRKATEQLLSNGFLDQGYRHLHDVLAASGLTLPRSGRSAMLRTFFWRARLCGAATSSPPSRCPPSRSRGCSASTPRGSSPCRSRSSTRCGSWSSTPGAWSRPSTRAIPTASCAA